MSFLIPKKPQILYAPMLASFGGGSARGFNPGGVNIPFSGSFTFTNAAVTGRTGPSLAQCRTAYASTAIGWDVNSTSDFNVTTTGFQDFRIPETGTYRLTVKGAKGGSGANGNNGVGGEGVIITVEFDFTEGEAIRVIVGQAGEIVSTDGGGGAGGGTFVLYGTSITAFQQTTSYFQSNYIVAAGGGGSGTQLAGGSGNGVDGTATSDDGTASRGGTGDQGQNGDGGSEPGGTWSGGSGAGVETNGTQGKESGVLVGTQPKSYANGFLGGENGPQYGGIGGFGGGAASSWAGGGGGGYSGGSGDSSVGSGTDKEGGGGGGTKANPSLAGGVTVISSGNHADNNGSVFLEKQ